MRYDGSVGDCPADDICELFADLFVYNVDTCDSDTENENVYGSSDGCDFSGIRLRMSDLEAAIFGLDANKRDPKITAFLLLLLNYAPMG
jgi:hypothetical protein